MSYRDSSSPDRGADRGGDVPRRPRPTMGGKASGARRVTPSYKPPVAPPPATTEPPMSEMAGPRPVSARQQAHREGRISGADIIDRAVPRRVVPPPTVPAGYRRSHVRDAETSSRRVRGKGNRRVETRPRANRRRVDWLAVSLRVAGAVLAVEIVAVLLFSPRLYVTQTVVSGNAVVPTERLLSLVKLKPHQNIVRLPAGQLRKAVLTEPEIATASIHRRFPGTVEVRVTERQPWASVCVPGDGCYTIDSTFVPFRATPEPEPNLPKLTLAAATPGGAVTPPITLGKPLTLPGLDVVSKCLTWAKGEKFAVGAVEIAPDGKLCLNKTDGAQVQLGAGVDLDGKLKALSTLLARRPELRDDPNLAYINLFDKEAPAVMTKTALAAQAALDKEAARKAGKTASPAAVEGDSDGGAAPAVVGSTAGSTGVANTETVP